tara:strand:+ start:360 stop:644 length:285 start_codon:yes stop_codon:yes gene_type:complete
MAAEDDFDDFYDLFCDVNRLRRLFANQHMADAVWGWRPGQRLFNAVEVVRPDVADRLRSTWLDPFYQDTIDDEVWEWLEAEWVTGPQGGAAGTN